MQTCTVHYQIDTCVYACAHKNTHTHRQDAGMATIGPIVMAIVQRWFPSEIAPAEEAKKGWGTDPGDFLRAKFMRTGQSRRTPGAWNDRRARTESDLGEGVTEEADQF